MARETPARRPNPRLANPVYEGRAEWIRALKHEELRNAKAGRENNAVKVPRREPK